MAVGSDRPKAVDVSYEYIIRTLIVFYPSPFSSPRSRATGASQREVRARARCRELGHLQPSSGHTEAPVG